VRSFKSTHLPMTCFQFSCFSVFLFWLFLFSKQVAKRLATVIKPVLLFWKQKTCFQNSNQTGSSFFYVFKLPFLKTQYQTKHFLWFCLKKKTNQQKKKGFICCTWIYFIVVYQEGNLGNEYIYIYICGQKLVTNRFNNLTIVLKYVKCTCDVF